MLYKSGIFLHIPLVVCSVQTCGGYGSEMECRGGGGGQPLTTQCEIYWPRVQILQREMCWIKFAPYITIHGELLELLKSCSNIPNILS